MKYRDRKLAAQYLAAEIGVPMTAQRLADLASAELGPRYVKINGRALYLVADLDAWIADQAARPVTRRTRRESDPAAA